MVKKVLNFYVEGFRSMTIGKTLWTLIFIKLFIIFAILKLFFFPRTLGGMTESEKAGYVTEQLTDRAVESTPNNQ